MRFISPVKIMEGEKNLTPWTRFDLTPYIPVTATFVIIEVVASLTRDENQSSKLICRASNDPHALRTYVLLEAKVPEAQILSTQALVPVGDATNIDIKVDGRAFDQGIDVEIIGFFEECPTLETA